MRYKVLGLVAVLLLWGLRGVAAEEKPVTSLPVPTAEEICAHPPEAKMPQIALKFQVSDREQQVPLPAGVQPLPAGGQPQRSDLEIQALRYVALVELGNCDVSVVDVRPLEASKWLPSQALSRRLEARPAERPALEKMLGGDQPYRTFADTLRAMAQGMPREAAPSPEMLASLGRGRPFFTVKNEDLLTTDLVSFAVTAPTIEATKEQVEAGVKLLAYSVFLQDQQEVVREIQRLCPRFQERRDQMAAIEKSLQEQAETRKAKGVEDLDQDALRTLKMQQRLVGVDIAGVVAKLEACNKILEPKAGKPVPSARADQVEALKVAAEIELVGLTARKQALDALVRQGETQNQWKDQKRELETKLAVYRMQRQALQRELVGYWTAYQANQLKPLTVTIHPLRWQD